MVWQSGWLFCIYWRGRLKGVSRIKNQESRIKNQESRIKKKLIIETTKIIFLSPIFFIFFMMEAMKLQIVLDDAWHVYELTESILRNSIHQKMG